MQKKARKLGKGHVRTIVSFPAAFRSLMLLSTSVMDVSDGVVACESERRAFEGAILPDKYGFGLYLSSTSSFERVNLYKSGACA